MTTNFDIFANAFNKYIVTPVSNFGLGGFVFDIEGESSVEATSEITDHYVEDNSTVQDHIAVRPDRITLKSYVGELVDRRDEDTNTFVQRVAQKLTTLGALLPTLSAAAQQAKSAVDAVRGGKLSLSTVTLESVNKTLDYWALARNLVGSATSRQQQAFRYLKSLQESKILVSVQTPFEFMTSMAIERINISQPENDRYKSDITVVLKKIRIASLQTVAANPAKQIDTGGATPPDFVPELSDKAFLQSQATNNVGNVIGVDPNFFDDAGPVRLTADNIGDLNQFNYAYPKIDESDLFP